VTSKDRIVSIENRFRPGSLWSIFDTERIVPFYRDDVAPDIRVRKAHLKAGSP